MRSEREKMLAGEAYDASDPELVQMRGRARLLLQRFNGSRDDQAALRQELLGELLGAGAEPPWIEPPFYCDYGSHIRLGKKVYFNFNCVVLDVAEVRIGDQAMFGPAVQIYTATHPMDWQVRAAGLEHGRPITIGAHVWVGGGAVICPGVRIGDRTVIGAGSVVTRDVPPDVFAAGNPCRIIRSL